VTRQRTNGYTWNAHIAELRHAHTVIRAALQDILTQPEMSRALRAEKVGRAALALSGAQAAIEGLESIAHQTHDQLTTLETKLERVK
jgi:hypothetical protein